MVVTRSQADGSGSMAQLSVARKRKSEPINPPQVSSTKKRRKTMGADVVEVQRLEQKKRDASIEKEARKAAQSQEIKSAIHQMALALDLPTWRIKSMLETAQLKVGGRQYVSFRNVNEGIMNEVAEMKPDDALYIDEFSENMLARLPAARAIIESANGWTQQVESTVSARVEAGARIYIDIGLVCSINLSNSIILSATKDFKPAISLRLANKVLYLDTEVTLSEVAISKAKSFGGRFDYAVLPMLQVFKNDLPEGMVVPPQQDHLCESLLVVTEAKRPHVVEDIQSGQLQSAAQALAIAKGSHRKIFVSVLSTGQSWKFLASVCDGDDEKWKIHTSRTFKWEKNSALIITILSDIMLHYDELPPSLSLDEFPS